MSAETTDPAADRELTDENLEAWVREVEAKGPRWVECSKLLALHAYGEPRQVTGVNVEALVLTAVPPGEDRPRRYGFKAIK